MRCGPTCTLAQASFASALARALGAQTESTANEQSTATEPASVAHTALFLGDARMAVMLVVGTLTGRT